LFLLGALCLLGAIFEDPVHLTSLFVGLMLMGVISWDQIQASIGRNGSRHTTPAMGTPVTPPRSDTVPPIGPSQQEEHS
jgi:hypothetical protein